VSSLVGIQFKFPAWEKKLKRHMVEIDLFIAAQMQTNRGMLFDREGAYNGHEPWAPLKFRSGQVLSMRGNLRRSLSPTSASGRPGPGGLVRMSGDLITIGSTLAYARMMNDGTAKMPGGVLRAKNAKALRIPVEKGFREEQKVRKSLLEEDLSNEESTRRKASLERRIGQIESLEGELKSNRKRELKRLKAELDGKAKPRKQSSSDGFIFRKSVKIPGRPFDRWNDADQAEFEAALTQKIIEVLNG
jgi:hypothetical protein